MLKWPTSKAKIMEELDSMSISYDPEADRNELWDLYKNNIENSEESTANEEAPSPDSDLSSSQPSEEDHVKQIEPEPEVKIPDSQTDSVSSQEADLDTPSQDDKSHLFEFALLMIEDFSMRPSQKVVKFLESQDRTQIHANEMAYYVNEHRKYANHVMFKDQSHGNIVRHAELVNALYHREWELAQSIYLDCFESLRSKIETSTNAALKSYMNSSKQNWVKLIKTILAE